MKHYQKNNGFTLIELLVVVLIIGILSSIALPQYEKAVIKARASEGFVMLKSLSDAASLYYLENGTFDGISMDTLTVQTLKETPYFGVSFVNYSDGHIDIVASNSKDGYILVDVFRSTGELSRRYYKGWTRSDIGNMLGATNCVEKQECLLVNF